MIAELLVISFTAAGGALAPVDVYTDSRPAHWREWTVISRSPLNREQRCQYRVDASRVLRDRGVTQGVPRKCMNSFTRTLRPDGAPRR